MDDSRLPKCVFYGELSVGKHPRYKPRKHIKDCIKTNLKALGISVGAWWLNVDLRGKQQFIKIVTRLKKQGGP